MSTNLAIERVCEMARSMAAELKAERRRRAKVEADNEALRDRLRRVEIALHSNAPLDALDVITDPPTPSSYTLNS